MKFFLDTANVEEIRQAFSLGLIDGVTTNPSLVAKEGRPFDELIHEICEVVQGPVSAEVVSTEANAMIKEGRHLAAIHEHVVVKCPLIREGIKATRSLADEGIRVNVTLCFSLPRPYWLLKLAPRISRHLSDDSMTSATTVWNSSHKYLPFTKTMVFLLRYWWLQSVTRNTFSMQLLWALM